MIKTPNFTSNSRASRADGQEARDRLFACALRLFAEKGFAKTSTRELAQAAQVNISAISYYFGDKAKLYRDVFNDSRCNPNIEPDFFDDTELNLHGGIAGMMRVFGDSMKQGELAQNCLKLHIREMLEPTGLWIEEIETQIKPAHQAFVRFLARHISHQHIDDDIHRLAFAISGLALTMMVNGDVIMAVRPRLINKDKAIDDYVERLTGYAIAMCHSESARRAQVV
jgi:AcrR family transcriptional regulator